MEAQIVPQKKHAVAEMCPCYFNFDFVTYGPVDIKFAIEERVLSVELFVVEFKQCVCRTALKTQIVPLMKQVVAEKCPSNFNFDFVANGLVDVKFANDSRPVTITVLFIGISITFLICCQTIWKASCPPYSTSLLQVLRSLHDWFSYPDICAELVEEGILLLPRLLPQRLSCPRRYVWCEGEPCIGQHPLLRAAFGGN